MNQKPKARKLKLLSIFFVIYLLFFILSATVPFMRFPTVSQEFKNNFSVNNFYKDSIGVDRASIIESSQDALDIRLHMLNEAKENIIISSFSIKHDRSCKELFSTILNAANRGVKVQVLVDGISGSYDMAYDMMYYVLGSNENIEFRYYNQLNLLKPWNINGRLHDKYIIIDNKLLILGGRNLSNYFLGEYNTKVLSYDRDIFVYNSAWNTSNAEQSVINEVKDYFYYVWNSQYNKTVFETVPFYKNGKMKDAKNELLTYYSNLILERPELFLPWDYPAFTVVTNKISLISNPIHVMSKEPYVWYQMHQLMLHAKNTITLQTPYAVLNDTMYNDLKLLNKAVPKVTLLLNSIAGGDNFMASSDYTWNRKKVIQTGVSLYEFQGEYSMHNKSILVDDDISIIGSYNLDMRSTYLDTEVMLVVHGEQFNALLTEHVLAMKDTSLPVNADGSYGTNKNMQALDTPTWKKLVLGVTSIIFQLIRYLL